MKKTIFWAAVMIAVVSTASYSQHGGHSGSSTGQNQQMQVPDAMATQIVLTVGGALWREGETCPICKSRIETAVKNIAGVSSASWDGITQKLQLAFNGSQTSLNVIARAIAEAGHDNELYRADDNVYAALYECCWYRSRNS